MGFRNMGATHLLSRLNEAQLAFEWILSKKTEKKTVKIEKNGKERAQKSTIFQRRLFTDERGETCGERERAQTTRVIFVALVIQK